MNERTISNILATLDTGLFHLSRDPMRNLLDSDKGMTFVPEMLREGAVIIIDCPVSVYRSMGAWPPSPSSGSPGIISTAGCSTATP